MGQSARKKYRSFSQRAMAIATDSNGNSARPSQSRTKAKSKHGGRSRVIQCDSYQAYTCQLSLLITLNARSYHTHRVVGHSDSKFHLKIQDRYTWHPRSFSDFLFRTGSKDPLYASLDNLKMLEENLLDAISTLHSHRISFPVTPEQIEFLTSPEDVRHKVKLYLPYNKKATWATEDIPPNWQADQLSDAKSIFFIPKLLLELSSPSPKLDLDFPTQKALAAFLIGDADSHHVDLCLGISPMVAELIYGICCEILGRWKGQECRDLLETFFGGPMPLPNPGTPPNTIYADFVQQRARVCDVERHRGSDGSVRDLPQLDSPATLAQLVCCRAEAAKLLKESSTDQWWITAMRLHGAFIPDAHKTVVEMVCFHDWYGYREKIEPLIQTDS